jgi:hypothetical protein
MVQAQMKLAIGPKANPEVPRMKPATNAQRASLLGIGGT